MPLRLQKCHTFYNQSHFQKPLNFTSIKGLKEQNKEAINNSLKGKIV